MGSKRQLLPPTRHCWICGRAVKLEDCKVDEHGLAVHELCHFAKLTTKKTFERDDRILQIARA
jgi:uncharacterized OB-fold protein